MTMRTPKAPVGEIVHPQLLSKREFVSTIKRPSPSRKGKGLEVAKNRGGLESRGCGRPNNGRRNAAAWTQGPRTRRNATKTGTRGWENSTTAGGWENTTLKTPPASVRRREHVRGAHGSTRDGRGPNAARRLAGTTRGSLGPNLSRPLGGRRHRSPRRAHSSTRTATRRLPQTGSSDNAVLTTLCSHNRSPTSRAYCWIFPARVILADLKKPT